MTEDYALAMRAQEMDLDSFNRLVLKYQELAFNVACRILSDPAAAEDATQLAFISAYRKISSYRGGSFKAWLMRIVTNACYDELRRQKRRPTTALEPINDDTGEEIDSPGWLADESMLPEELIEIGELDKAVQHCLDNLPVDFKVVAVMIDVEGLDYQAVSEAVGKPLGTVKSRLSRARQRLQNCLQAFQELLPHKYRLESGIR
jgi:RNA polymerase sigma-70 factor (ECF subfamily)